MSRGSKALGDWMAIDDQDPHSFDVASVMGSSTRSWWVGKSPDNR
jgi:hypothetical protein